MACARSPVSSRTRSKMRAAALEEKLRKALKCASKGGPVNQGPSRRTRSRCCTFSDPVGPDDEDAAVTEEEGSVRVPSRCQSRGLAIQPVPRILAW